MKENPIIVYPRPGFELDEASFPKNVQLVDAPQFDVSSTFIRDALKEGKDVRYFLHPSTWSALCLN